MQWIYKNIPLKEYLETLVKDPSDLSFLYSTARKILAKEYSEASDMDALITSVLSRDKIQKIIAHEYTKQNKRTWTYRDTPLKEYLSRLLANESALEFLYDKIKVLLEREYAEGDDLDALIENILSRPSIVSIIDGHYVKKSQENWIYEGMSLTDYIESFISSPYRTTRKIRQNIQDNVMRKIKRENESTVNKSALIKEYVESPQFAKFISAPPRKRRNYYYEGQSLYKYVKENVKDKSNLNYIYCFIVGRISKMLACDKNRSLDDIIKSVMASPEVLNLIETDSLSKMTKGKWPCGNGLLIDYLRGIGLYGKALSTVYLQVKYYINSRYPDGFTNIEEKKRAIEAYVQSIYFANYLKYGYMDKTYFYENMLLIDYIKIHYSEELSRVGKTPDDLYAKIVYMLSQYENASLLSGAEKEDFLGRILRSDELREYLHTKKIIHEDWRYHGRNLKEVIAEVYESTIEDDRDLKRIYAYITRLARQVKLTQTDAVNDDIIGTFLTREYVEEFKVKYARQKRQKLEVQKKNILFTNRDDEDYIKLYARENDLDMNSIYNIKAQGFNFYSAIIILEYSIIFCVPIEKLIAYTLQTDSFDDIYMLWLFKLGFKDYIADVMENNKKLINLWINKSSLRIFKDESNIDYDDIYANLLELLLTKHVILTVPIESLFASFCSFVQSSIIRILMEIKRRGRYFDAVESLDDEDFYFQATSNEFVEDDYIVHEDSSAIGKAIDSLDDLEREFVDLRFGFTGEEHSLLEIQKKWASREIFVSIEELQQCERDILNKLKSNPHIIAFRKN